MAKDWFNLRVKVPVEDFRLVRTKIAGWPEEVAKEIYWPRVKKIAEEGAEIIRFIIIDEATDTGRERARRGGNGPGRVKSETMLDAVGSRVRERANGGFSAFVGWVNGRPGYAIFQEMGVPGGVKGMESVRQAREYMLSQLKALSKGRYEG